MLYFGECQLACQVVDVMVHPSERGMLTRRGPFFLAASHFLEHHIGFGARHLLGFGFPNQRAMKVAERLGLYAEVGKMIEIQWPPSSIRRRFTQATFPLASSEDARAIVERLWSDMRKDLRDAIVGARDWPYIEHRYLTHPERHYEALVVVQRLTGRPLALAVLQEEGERWELLDVIGALRHVPLAIGEARRLAWQRGGKGLYCWISETYASPFLETGGEARDIRVRIPANAWTPGPDPEEINGRWWLMSGDTDFH
ncbi:MAG: hypothetical protein D6819_10920 [Gammaproteobacteria bacterium]|nr:MAG: hypothetical protein D6819_10920 [Gammaproteobacteria bacterium]